jgi:hypothetical protein
VYDLGLCLQLDVTLVCLHPPLCCVCVYVRAQEYQQRWNENTGKVAVSQAPDLLPYIVPQPSEGEPKVESALERLVLAEDKNPAQIAEEEDVLNQEALQHSNSEIANEATMHLANKIANHTRWSEASRA